MQDKSIDWFLKWWQLWRLMCGLMFRLNFLLKHEQSYGSTKIKCFTRILRGGFYLRIQFILKLRYLWLGCDGFLRPKLGFVWLVNGRSLWVKALWTIRKFSDSNSTSCLARLRDPTSLRGSRWPSARKLTKHSNYLCVSEGGPSIMVQSWPWVSLKAVKKVVFDYRALNAIWKKIVSFVFKQRKMTFCIHNGLSVCVHI